MSASLKKTPLHDWHVQRGGRIVEFAGWHMPVQYAGIVAEHHAVRQRAGLFDVSHMGEIRVRGAGSLAFLQRLITNDASVLEDGQAQYTVMTNEEGGIIDDLLVYRLSDNDFFLVVNAATTPKDVDWVMNAADGTVEIEDQSADWAQLALQGPRSEEILSRVLSVELADIRYYRSRWTEFAGAEALVSRTGYTGEDGFEVYIASDRGAELAEALMAAGEEDGLQPVGLGARDTLRLEAGMLLYGNDMDEGRTPVEAGLKWLIKPDKGEFIGREALASQLQGGVDERLVGFQLRERGVPRHGYSLLEADGDEIGEVSSGSYSPTLEAGIGLGYVPSEQSEVGSAIAVEIRGRRVAAEIVATPFYKRPR